jgi:hypothetical protein
MRIDAKAYLTAVGLHNFIPLATPRRVQET